MGSFATRRKSKHWLLKYPKRTALGAAGIILAFILIFGGIFYWWVSKDLPSPGKLSADRQSSTVVYDKDGKVVHQIYEDEQRVPAKSEEISDLMKKATVSIEDKGFYKHGGFSQTGIIRAFFSTATKQGVQGGSTITQQLIKNTLLTNERSIIRKIKEVILAVQVEKIYTKDEILTMYLNEAAYGGTYVGVGAAAKGYFDKKPSELTLVEAAFLSGLPQAPSLYSPFVAGGDAWKGRTKDVLGRMKDDKQITQQEYDKAMKQVDGLKFAKNKVAITAPHFVFFVKKFAEEELGVAQVSRGVRIKTTLDLDLQKKAEEIVNSEVEAIKKLNVGNGAALVVDTKTGEIRAMVGSYDFNNTDYGKFNVAADPAALRQPGSTLKPFLVATGLEKKIITPSSVIMDTETVFPQENGTDYKPVNYDGTFRGPVQIRFALGNSLNIPMVKLLARVGLEDFLRMVSQLGLTSLSPTKENLGRLGLSIALGGGDTTMLQLAGAYTTLARGGSKVDVTSVLEITDYKGKVLYRRPEPKVSKVLDPAIAFIIAHILSDNEARKAAFGPSSLLVIPGKTVAVKTGTTNDKRDNWAAGFTNGITIITWVGNNDNTPMNQAVASGITGASPIWNKIMKEALKKYDDGIIAKPDDVEAVEIDAWLGGKPKDGQEKRSEYFLKDTKPESESSWYKKLKISKHDSNKLANDKEIERGEYDEKDFVVIEEEDPVSQDGKNRWQEAILAWAEKQDAKFRPPKETSDYKPADPQPTSAPTSVPVVQTNTPVPTLTPSPTPTP